MTGVLVTPTDNLQVVAWIEDAAGQYVDTIYITDLTGRHGPHVIPVREPGGVGHLVEGVDVRRLALATHAERGREPEELVRDIQRVADGLHDGLPEHVAVEADLPRLGLPLRR